MSATSANNSTSPKTVTATCPVGTLVLGGGAQLGGVLTGPVEITSAYPASNTTFTASATEDGMQTTSSNWTITAWDICA